MKKFLLNGLMFLGLAFVTTACSHMKHKCCTDGKTSACCESKEGCKDGSCDAKKVAPADAAPTAAATPATKTTTTKTKKTK